MNQEKIGKFVAELRKEKKMTQEELAEKMGVTDKSISRWENGKTMPDLSMIPILAEILDVEISELLNGRKMTKEELIIMRDTLNNVIDYNNSEKKNKAMKLNILFASGLFLILIGTLNNQFDILYEVIKNNHISQGLTGAIYGLGIGFELIAFYNNNHNITLKQKKLNLIRKQK